MNTEIKQTEIAILEKQKDVAAIQDDIKHLTVELETQVCAALNDEGKAKYSNESARKNAVALLMKDDKVLREKNQKLSTYATSIELDKIEDGYLHRRFQILLCVMKISASKGGLQ